MSTNTVRFRVGTASDRGPRAIQADSVGCNTTPNTVGAVSFAISDGIGDTRDAADTAAKAVSTAVDHDHDSAAVALIDAAAPVVEDHALAPAGQAGDATLVVVVASTRDCIYRIAWVGDSRAWHHDDTGLTQITRDHTLGQQLRDRGIDAAPRFDHCLTRALSTVEDKAIGEGRVCAPIGRLILTTDGVHKTLSASEIRGIADAFPDPHDCAARLVAHARECGSHDNATALVADPYLTDDA
ncbi:serine/threonine protein phosphatase [Saccharopolyspora sp. K220]|uniref:PP2C family protein-serine/threonine phosphatase n=1 Tax=Saccharopolyspora soli TaxID=2926618 RepID=UPI001F5A2C9A|nr:serine/threonine protein phosphatase [Saccharopolyspora soli]MCI2422481.1 serine/threonine protein phosphatase [Saccharopolyspora soli]